MIKFLTLLVIILFFRIVIFYSSVPSLKNETHAQRTVFTNIKEKISETYSLVLPPRGSNLLMGIVFGQDPETSVREKFINTGVMHVVAASGMNVTMLTAFVLTIFATFLKRQVAVVLTAIILVFYTGLADFQPSIVRAAVMGLIALSASLFGRQNTALLALFFAAFLMIFWDPTILISISFILSFSATLGIILLDPILKKAFKHPIFDDFRTTIAAQIATTPILIFFFSNYSPVSILVNILILWTIPPLMVLGGIVALLAFISPLFASIVLYLALPLLSYFNYIVDIFSIISVPIEIEKIPSTIIVGYYLILLALVIKLNKGLVHV